MYDQCPTPVTSETTSRPYLERYLAKQTLQGLYPTIMAIGRHPVSLEDTRGNTHRFEVRAYRDTLTISDFSELNPPRDDTKNTKVIIMVTTDNTDTERPTASLEIMDAAAGQEEPTSDYTLCLKNGEVSTDNLLGTYNPHVAGELYARALQLCDTARKFQNAVTPDSAL